MNMENKMSNQPKISVIMGIYNSADTLAEAVNSILAQTYTNWILILCDDASTDNTFEVAQQIQMQYPEKIILLKNQKNSNLSFTLNHCLKYATGEFVARMDADDRSAPERFEKQIEYLKDHPEIQLVGCAMQRFGTGNRNAEIIYGKKDPNNKPLHLNVPFCHATIMTYRYVYEQLNGYTVSPRTVRGQDVDLWFRFFHAGFKGANLAEPLYYVREDDNARKRRTLKGRWNAFKTTVIGYRLLNYPCHWLVVAFVVFCIKACIPQFLISFYQRNFIKNK